MRLPVIVLSSLHPALNFYQMVQDAVGMNFTLTGLSDLQSLCCTFDGMRHSCFLMTGISVFFVFLLHPVSFN